MNIIKSDDVVNALNHLESNKEPLAQVTYESLDNKASIDIDNDELIEYNGGKDEL